MIVLGVPFNGDGTPPDQKNPANSLRQAGLLKRLRSGERSVIDLGDVAIPEFDGDRDPETRILNLHTWLMVSERVAETIAQVDDKAFPVVLGGDCSILLGIFGGFALQDRQVGLAMLDGHTDYREPARSETGEPADLELAVLTGLGPQRVTQCFGKCPLIREEDVIFYGYREPDEIERSNIRRFDRVTMASLGITESVRKGIAGFREGMSIWLHFDVDALDPSVMPVCYPEPNGLTVDEITQFIDAFLETGRVIGLSLGCYHPTLDSTGQGADAIVSIFSSLNLSQNRDYPPE